MDRVRGFPTTIALAMSRLVLRLPKGLAEKVQAAADEEDLLPTEWVRDVIRDALDEEPEPEGPEEPEPEEPEAD